MVVYSSLNARFWESRSGMHFAISEVLNSTIFGRLGSPHIPAARAHGAALALSRVMFCGEPKTE